VELGPALSSAIADVERSVPGARVVRVDEQLMNLGDLAAHLDRTTESVRLLATAARGPGGFPSPAAGAHRREQPRARHARSMRTG
jgi:hypothetical protein